MTTLEVLREKVHTVLSIVGASSFLYKYMEVLHMIVKCLKVKKREQPSHAPLEVGRKERILLTFSSLNQVMVTFADR